jgi:hypothetical protein
VTLVASAWLAAPAGAFTEIKISEIYPGSVSGGGSDEGAFVELQMHADGQNDVAGTQLRFYDNAGGGMFDQLTLNLGTNVPNGSSQRTILVGMSDVPGGVDFNEMALGGDFVDPGQFMTEEAGALCYGFPSMFFFVPVDCVSWGAFTNPTGIPVGASAAPGGIPIGQSLSRSIARGCPTLLEDADDSDDSATDFSLTVPTPRRNSVPPTETPCPEGGGEAGDTSPPETTITKGPKNKTKKKTATFEFSSTEPGSSFECILDGKTTFKACASPFIVKVKRGKHTFQVQATDQAGNVDDSPATDDWKVKKKKKKKK